MWRWVTCCIQPRTSPKNCLPACLPNLYLFGQLQRVEIKKNCIQNMENIQSFLQMSIKDTGNGTPIPWTMHYKCKYMTTSNKTRLTQLKIWLQQQCQIVPQFPHYNKLLALWPMSCKQLIKNWLQRSKRSQRLQTLLLI